MSAAGPSNNQNTFGFSAKPKVVKPRSKFRENAQPAEEESQERLQNVMFEKRVVRGNTYARIVTSKDSGDVKDLTKSGRSFQRDLQAPSEQADYLKEQGGQEPGTPRAVSGRQNIEVQTDEFVETLTDKPPQYEKDTQTEIYIERPNPRLFMPKKTGEDRETQIWDGDLFDFDYEVEPILQVLLGKTIELSRMEVLEEEELRVMKEQQKKFEQLKNAEIAEIQRLEGKEKRLFDESERRKNEYRKQKDLNVSAHKQMISRSSAKIYLRKLKANVHNLLEDHGVFREPLQSKLYEDYLPWLFTSVQDDLISEDNIQSQLENICDSLVNDTISLHKKNYDEEIAKRAAIKEDMRRKQEDLDQRREKKRIAKLRKIEMERRAKLRDEVAARILSKAEMKDNVFQQLISDIDGNLQEGRPYIGLVGGLIGEFVVFMSALQQADDAELQRQAREVVEDEDNIAGVFKELLVSVLSEGQIELPISLEANTELGQLQGELTIATLSSSQLEPEMMDEAIRIIQANVASQILNAMKEQEGETLISSTIVDRLIQEVLNLYAADETMREKIKLVGVKRRVGFEKCAGIAYVRPDLASLPLNTKSARFGLEPEIGEDEEPVKLVPQSLIESEYQNKVSLFVPKDEDLEVFVQHAVAEQVIREDILRILANSLKGIEGKEYGILLEAEGKAQANQKLVIDAIHNDFPVLDMKAY